MVQPSVAVPARVALQMALRSACSIQRYLVGRTSRSGTSSRMPKTAPRGEEIDLIANYFGGITRTGILTAVAAVENAIAPAWNNAKKSGLAAMVERKIAKSGWLPEVLRHRPNDKYSFQASRIGTNDYEQPGFGFHPHLKSLLFFSRSSTS